MPIAMEQLMDCIENPVKTRIILTLQEKGTSTPKDLLKVNSDIPKATLYRALKSMETSGVIEVVAEEKVRAVVEKTYAVSKEFERMDEAFVTNNDGEAYYKMFSAFVLGLLKKFEVYAKSKNIDIASDGTSFNAIPLYATAEELTKYSEQIVEVLSPAIKRSNKEQRRHTLAMIISPPLEND